VFGFSRHRTGIPSIPALIIHTGDEHREAQEASQLPRPRLHTHPMPASAGGYVPRIDLPARPMAHATNRMLSHAQFGLSHNTATRDNSNKLRQQRLPSSRND
jgi:hypothetical protein